MEKKRMCLLDETKVCDDCGECDRCDLDPNKICDNCCKCIAMEDEGNEFRSRTITRGGMKKEEGAEPFIAPLYKKKAPAKKTAAKKTGAKTAAKKTTAKKAPAKKTKKSEE